MKTKLTALLLAAALALTLAACGEKDIADTPLPDEPPEPVAEQPAADDEWIVLHTTGKPVSLGGKESGHTCQGHPYHHSFSNVVQ